MNRTIFDAFTQGGAGLLKSLSSLKLTVGLIFFISLLCLVGTVFPQGGDISSGGHGWASGIPRLLSPYDIFHSIWFMGAGFLLSVNLVLCMKQRARLKKRNLLMMLLHGSILLIIAGYALGFMSLDGFMEIPEGATVSAATLKGGAAKELGFSVRCDRFEVEYYDNGMPKEFVSDLSFIKDGQVAHRAQLMVNHPARFSGVSFYQETYRQSLTAEMTLSDGKKTVTLKVAEGDVIPLSTAGAQAGVVKVWDDLMNAGPAVKLLIKDSSGERFLWVFKHVDVIRSRVPDLFERMPGFDPSSFRPYTFSIEKLQASYVTGIGVKRDPGIPLVGAGGALFLVSLLLVYRAPHRPGLQKRDAQPIQGKDKGKGDEA